MVRTTGDNFTSDKPYSPNGKLTDPTKHVKSDNNMIGYVDDMNIIIPTIVITPMKLLKP